MTLLRRHPVAATLIVVLLASAVAPVPALVDALTGAPPGNAELDRPVSYLLLAPVSNTLDALTFFSIERAPWALAGWAALLLGWAVARPGGLWPRLGRAIAGLAALVILVAAAVVLPRPVPRLVVTSGSLAVIDYHAHTESSHDGRPGWTAARVAAWHARQGFGAAYVTDHNRVFPGAVGVPQLLPGAEWSVHRQHVLALGPAGEIQRDRFLGSTERMLGLFAALHRQGTLAIAALPEYWRNHMDAVNGFVAAGVDGFELVDCAPKALGFPSAGRGQMITLARQHDLLLVGGSDNHGWGAVTCVWNLAAPGAGGFHGNRVLVRSLALSQGDGWPWAAAVTQPWRLVRTLTWSERVSWLTWIAVILLYRAAPRRTGQTGGFAILARSLKLRALLRPAPPPDDGG